MSGDGIRSVGDLVERAFEECRPIYANLELTYKCNLLCSFCYNAPKDVRELDGDEWIATIRKLKAAGGFNVTLTGGEPFLHRDYFRIAESVRAEGLVLKTYTNGVLLADRERAERYAALAPFATEMSLHGATAPTHDRLTGIRGSFDKLMVALGHLADLGVFVVLKTPVTRLNQRELRDIEAIGDRFGYRVSFDTNITPTDDGDLAPLKLAAEREFLVAFFVDLAKRGRAGLGPRVLEKTKQACGTGRTSITIDPYGNLFPCVAWRSRPLGNIRHIDDLAAVWHGTAGAPHPELAYVRKVAEELPRTTLASRPEGAFASFCPAVAERETGNAYNFYPAARLSGLSRLAAHERYEAERDGTSSGDLVAPTDCPA